MYNALLFKYKRNNKRLGNSFNEKKKFITEEVYSSHCMYEVQFYVFLNMQ